MSRLFKRNNKTTIAELEEYYANQDRKKTRTGMAWLMAILSLLITLLVIAMIFFGGRWVYRALTDNDSNTVTTTGNTNSNGVNLPTFDGSVVGQGNTNPDDSSSAESSTDSNTGTTNAGVVTDEAATTSIPNTDRVIAETGSEDETIPNTGAGELLLITPIAIAVAGYFVSRKLILKNN